MSTASVPKYTDARFPGHGLAPEAYHARTFVVGAAKGGRWASGEGAGVGWGGGWFESCGGVRLKEL